MNRKAYSIGAIALLLISISVAHTQEGTQDERVSTATNLVTVNVIVADRNGREVRGLEREQFEVYDDKLKQQIAHFSSAAAPFSIGIICEIHNSAPEKTRAMLIALKQFTRGLRNEDDFFFTTFGPTGSVTTEFVPTYDQVYGHLSVVKPGGPSSLYDSVYTAADRLRGRRNLKKALLIVSDGQDDNSRVSYKKFAIGWENSMYRSTPLGLPVRRRTSRLVTAGEDLTRPTGTRAFFTTPT